jgi:hypothetical protein
MADSALIAHIDAGKIAREQLATLADAAEHSYPSGDSAYRSRQRDH